MYKGKIFAAVGMTLLGGFFFTLLYFRTSQAQVVGGPKLLQVADIDSVSGMSTSDPLANYPAGNAQYPGQEISYDNEGISIFIAPTSQQTPITTDINVPECGHLGIQEWKGGNYAYKLTDGNTWQKRKSPCAGYVVIGSSGQIRAQTLTIKGTSVEGKPFTLQVNVPDYSLWDKEVGGGSRRLYVDDTGATFGCYDPAAVTNGQFTRIWPNECQFSPQQALARASVGASPTGGPVNGNGLCQAGETSQNAPADCPATYAFSLTKISATGNVLIQGATGTQLPASIKFKLQNTGNVDTEFPVYCDSGFGAFVGNMYYLNADGTLGAKFLNPGAFTGTTSLPSGNIVLTPGAEKSFEFKYDIPATPGAVGTWTVKCHTYPMNIQTRDVFTDKKQEISDVLTVTAPAVVSDSPATAKLTQLFPGQYSNTKFSITIDDTDGISEFSVKKIDGTSIYGGSPGARGNVGVCGGASMVKTTTSSTVTLESKDFPLAATVYDCRFGGGSFTFPVPSLSTTTPPPPPPPGGSGPTVSLTALTQYGTNKYSIKVEDLDGIKEFSVKKKDGSSLYGGSPGATGNVGSCTGTNPFETVTSGTVTIETGDFPLQAWLADCKGNGGSNSTFSVSAPGGVTPPPPGDTTPRACGAGEKCPKGSWCQNAKQCYYPDSQVTCAAWSNTPSVSTVCPVGTSVCKPDDTSCITPGNYGPSAGWCADSMKCFQKEKDAKENNDVYCPLMPTSTTAGAMSDVSCPSGYSVCSASDATCKQKGDSWTDAGSGYYCMSSQKCTLATGGGKCVGWNETCPAGTKYCDANSPNCVEPDTYKTISSGGGATNTGYWCGGGGMSFYSSTQIYCPPKRASNLTSGMWTGAEVKEILAKLGAGFGLCRPGEANCIEPGKTGSGNSWCAWWPPSTTGPVMAPTSSSSSTRTCPSLDGGDITPPPPPSTCPDVAAPKCAANEFPETDRNGCFTGACKKQTICPSISPPLCKPGEVLKDRTSPSGCPGFECVPADEVRECGPNEMPGMVMGASMGNFCRMPMYRWSINDKKWEKCDAKNPPAWVNIQGNTKATYTNCQSFGNFELEKEWLTERFLLHDPRIDGDWYMPPWDAASEMYRYNPKTDGFEVCSKEMNGPPMYTADVRANEYYAPCNPIPEKDKGWLLKKARAEYKMWQLWSNRPQEPVNPEKPILPVLPIRPELPVIPIPEIPIAQCKGYLAGIRQSLAADKQFWKDMNNQLSQVSEQYADASVVKQLLDDAKPIILDLDKLVKLGKCTTDVTTEIQTKTNKLRTEIFPELSSYLVSLHDYAQYGQCRTVLDDKVKQLKELEKKEFDAETSEGIAQLLSDAEAKMKEFEERFSDFDYDASFECQNFTRELEGEMAPLFRLTDRNLNRIIDQVVTEKLRPELTKLTEELEKRGKALDELLVQLGQLHQAVEDVTQSAAQISEKISVSYTALARIEEKFAAEKEQMQAAKDRLIPLIEQATQVIRDSRCLLSADQERMVQEFGNIAAVNWISDGDDQMEKRLNLFIASCRERAVVATDVTSFMDNFEEAAARNLALSFEGELTHFSDVPTHEWYYGAMETAWRGGRMTQGRPAENVLKQDALLMMLREIGATDTEIEGNCQLNVPEVTSVSPYAVCAVNLAASKGIALRGAVDVPVSRVEMVQWLVTLKGLPAAPATVLDRYKDLYGLTEGERTAIAAVVSSGVMVGSVNSESATFSPHSPITRAALAVILEKLNPDLQH